MAEKISFVAYHDWVQQTAFLTNEQFGELMRGVFSYSMSGTVPSITDPAVFACFQCIKIPMDRDRQKWETTCAKRKAAGSKGGRPRKNQPEPMPYYPPEPEPQPEPELKTQPTNETLFLDKNQMVASEPEYEAEYEHDNESDCELAKASASAAAEKEPDGLSELLVKETGITPTEKQKVTMAGWCRKYGREAVESLIREAGANDAHTFAYLVAIVRRWERDGGPTKPRRRKCQGPQPCAAPHGASQAELDANRQQLERILAETEWVEKGVSA